MAKKAKARKSTKGTTYARGHLRGTIESIMRSSKVRLGSMSDDAKSKVVEKALAKVPGIKGGEGRVRSIMNYVNRTGYSEAAKPAKKAAA